MFPKIPQSSLSESSGFPSHPFPKNRFIGFLFTVYRAPWKLLHLVDEETVPVWGIFLVGSFIPGSQDDH